MIGIYKITSPTGKVYIGQSVDINRRKKQYRSLDCKDQPALYNSFMKHSFSKHSFEVIEKCEIESLNCRERFWQEFYKSIENGLNCKYTNAKDKKGRLSEETKRKISIAQIGELNHRYGKPGPSSMLGKKHTLESRRKISEGVRGLTRSTKAKKNISKSKKGELNPMYGTVSPFAAKVVCTKTGREFTSIKAASEFVGVKYRTLVWYLTHPETNKTSLIRINKITRLCKKSK